MVSDSPHDRWLFLLTLAPLPLGCTEVIYLDPPGDDSSSGTTTPTPMGDTSEGSTSVVTTTGVDGTSSTGDDTTSAGVSSDSTTTTTTTMPTEPSSSSEESSSTTGELGLCQAFGQTMAACYYYYNEIYLTYLCYNYLNNYVDPACLVFGQHYMACYAYGPFCWPDCYTEYESMQQCHNDILAMQLGCNLIPVVPGAGTIDAQCSDLTAQATTCHSAGYYIPGFSWYIPYAPQYAQDFCEYGAFFTFLYPPPVAGDACGGAYEELLTCLSGLSCNELANEMFAPTVCATQDTAVECRCNLGA
jgi:hypothetical protein